MAPEPGGPNWAEFGLKFLASLSGIDNPYALAALIGLVFAALAAFLVHHKQVALARAALGGGLAVVVVVILAALFRPPVPRPVIAAVVVEPGGLDFGKEREVPFPFTTESRWDSFYKFKAERTASARFWVRGKKGLLRIFLFDYETRKAVAPNTSAQDEANFFDESHYALTRGNWYTLRLQPWSGGVKDEYPFSLGSEYDK